jgi:hypothetical protein
MVLHDEKMQILNMIFSGQITAEEGAKLLSALKTGSRESGAEDSTPARWFRVRVTDLKTGKVKVNVNIPMALVDVGIKMGARFVPDQKEMDWKALAEAVRGGAQGKVMDVEDDEGGERVEIFVE